MIKTKKKEGAYALDKLNNLFKDLEFTFAKPKSRLAEGYERI